jgi:hypothetical protein
MDVHEQQSSSPVQQPSLDQELPSYTWTTFTNGSDSLQK